MLVLTRKIGESIHIGDYIMELLEVQRDSVKISLTGKFSQQIISLSLRQEVIIDKDKTISFFVNRICYSCNLRLGYAQFCIKAPRSIRIMRSELLIAPRQNIKEP
ncbi:TPA: carbon storage regulator [Candidatus Berkelbacteria bacterium]|uniref:Translational regulator CsrA n=1 Tax=Berkelbacteria bacterium GW2011_GWE1_39_12 TaxID=1618337 RepID=A0A0G4B4D9_9BACT|nr:MAG: hypothetical protein UT28_C0001G0043 [Berkelbacteria bacterium GW2011_GWE1_39_12]HBO60433.1 carbon storage regulator [Candidatus Berkelbacteria bacterium]